ncbi:MAG: helix-turn-helix domain-containing protein [Gracilibacteraceae bacterium]|jgi:hypothetical protein|nr:helix-turn-helix domain-containing protein [Gracilibacteraceae bacterium]
MLDVTYREAGPVVSRLATPEELADMDARRQEEYHLELEREERHMAKQRVSQETIEQIRQLRAEGLSIPKIAQKTGVSATTVTRHTAAGQKKDAAPISRREPAAAAEKPGANPAPRGPERADKKAAKIVTVRWLDGYLEGFQATDVRFDGYFLRLRLDSGGARIIPLVGVRWFRQGAEDSQG